MPTQPTPIIFKITNAGKQAALDKAKTGLSISLAYLAIGSSKYTPKGTETALKTEIKRQPIVSGDIEPNTNTLRFSSTIYADAITEVYEMGLFTDKNTLFAVASTTTTPLLTVHPNIAYVGGFGLTLDDIGADSVTVTTDPNGALSLVIMENHLAAPNPHPQYLTRSEHNEFVSDHLGAPDPHSQYLNTERFQFLMRSLIPLGYLHHSHSTSNPKPLFDELLGMATHWRRLTGRIIVATDPADTHIKDAGITLGQKGLVNDPSSNRPHVWPLQTTHIFERYNPEDIIETVWGVKANKNSVNEGDTIRFTVTANNLPDGQILNWTIKEGALNAASNDVTNPDNTANGTVILRNGAATIDYITTPNDNQVEPQKHVRLTVGAPANLSMNVSINDAGHHEKVVHVSQSTYEGLTLDAYYKKHAGQYATSTDTIRFIVDTGVDIVAPDADTGAIESGSNWPAGSNIVIENHGRILGRGGDGGQCARYPDTHPWGGFNSTVTGEQILANVTPAGDGGDGGVAIKGSMLVENHGLIAGGGGGGGGSGLFFLVANDSGYDRNSETGGSDDYLDDDDLTRTGSANFFFWIGGHGGSGGGAPYGKRYTNVGTVQEFIDHFNGAAVLNQYKIAKNDILLLRTEDKQDSYYSKIEGNESVVKTIAYRAPSIAQNNLYVKTYNKGDSDSPAYKVTNDDGFILFARPFRENKWSQNGSLTVGGSGGYHIGSAIASRTGNEDSPSTWVGPGVELFGKNHGGNGGDIGADGTKGVIAKYHNLKGEVSAEKVFRLFEPGKGGRAGKVFEGNVTIQNLSGGTTKGRA